MRDKTRVELAVFVKMLTEGGHDPAIYELYAFILPIISPEPLGALEHTALEILQALGGSA